MAGTVGTVSINHHGNQIRGVQITPSMCRGIVLYANVANLYTYVGHFIISLKKIKRNLGDAFF